MKKVLTFHSGRVTLIGVLLMQTLLFYVQDMDE